MKAFKEFIIPRRQEKLRATGVAIKKRIYIYIHISWLGLPLDIHMGLHRTHPMLGAELKVRVMCQRSNTTYSAHKNKYHTWLMWIPSIVRSALPTL